jgi:membrane protease subunit HflK
MRGDFAPPDIKLPKISAGAIRWILIAVVVIILLVGSIYQVSPEEIGCRACTSSCRWASKR